MTDIFFNVHIVAISLSYMMFFAASLAALLYLVQDYNLKTKHLGAVFNRLPDLSLLDKINYKSVGFGFPLLTLAFMIGALCARDVRGSYWSWTPREAFSLILWLLYAIILHVRLSSKMRGKKVALLSILAFFVIVVSLLVNCGGTR